jgi:hypothetical protein
MSQVETLPIAQIVADPSLTVREKLDEGTVERYRESLDRLPPVIVYRLPDGEVLLTDGFHRQEAHRREGRETVQAEVREGTREDAREHAILANVSHGRPYTRAERRLAIEQLLRLRPERSDAWIARDLAVSSNTVRSVREALEAAAQIERLDRLVGADGKERPREIVRAAPEPPDDGDASNSAWPGAHTGPDPEVGAVATGADIEPGPGAAPPPFPEPPEGGPLDDNGRRGEPETTPPSDRAKAPAVLSANWRILRGRVERFAAHYRGPAFHALLCDPPYHLIQSSRNGSPRQPGSGPFGRHTISTKGFMSLEWDGGAVSFDPDTWAALAAHLHPGAFGMAFASSRGWHRLAVAIEDAGLVIHPSVFNWRTGETYDVGLLGWAFASGLPKATRIDTQIDEAAGVLGERQVVGRYTPPNGKPWNLRQAGDPSAQAAPGAFTASGRRTLDVTAPATPLAAAWEGHRYGLQALKPALEPIIVFQKPYAGRPVDCIVETGAGALWIEGAQIPANGRPVRVLDAKATAGSVYAGRTDESWAGGSKAAGVTTRGRWPAHLTLTHHPDCRRVGEKEVEPAEVHRPNPVRRQADGQMQFNQKPPGYQKTGCTNSNGREIVEDWACVDGCPVKALGEQSGVLASGTGAVKKESAAGFRRTVYGAESRPAGTPNVEHGDAGTAARFFFNADWSCEGDEFLAVAERLAAADPVQYVAKAATSEREAGLHGVVPCARCGQLFSQTHYDAEVGHERKCRRCKHPAIKPLALTRFLATLLLPPAEYAPRRLLVPFAGAASEMIGAALAGFEEIVGVEMDADYCQIGEARLAHWTRQAE